MPPGDIYSRSIPHVFHGFPHVFHGFPHVFHGIVSDVQDCSSIPFILSWTVPDFRRAFGTMGESTWRKFSWKYGDDRERSNGASYGIYVNHKYR